MDQIVTITLADDEMEMIKANAKAAEIGGRSSRSLHARHDFLPVDQLVGQICEAAAAMYLTGSLDGYLASRERANANKYAGDGGRDIIGLSVDIKGSLMRSDGRPEDYRLIVRPRERHDRWVYVLAIVATLEAPVTVHLCGWTRDADLPPADTEGPFRGAHTVWAEDLRPVQKLRTVVRKFWHQRADHKCFGSQNA